jgi:hypothetical protein
MPTFPQEHPVTIPVHSPDVVIRFPSAIIEQIRTNFVVVDFDGIGKIDAGQLRTLLKRHSSKLLILS